MEQQRNKYPLENRKIISSMEGAINLDSTIETFSFNKWLAEETISQCEI